jgi:DNA-binding GntR family transcriptional regulator
MTVRRNIQELDTQGLVRRVRGGAVAPVVPRAFGERAATRSAAKITIARKAMSLVPTEGAVGVRRLHDEARAHGLGGSLEQVRALVADAYPPQRYEPRG